MSTFNVTQACANALQKACATYTAEIFSELQRQGVMTETQVEVASKFMGASKVKVGKKTKTKKAAKPKVKTPSMLIPFCGEENKEWCCGVRVNQQLFTQCTKGRVEGEDYCKLCQKQSENGASGKPNGGDIRERVALGTEWRDPKGKAPITFATLLNKPKFSGLSIKDAEQAVAAFGWTIPESERKVADSKRGRPKKVVEVSDTDSEDGQKKKKKRGRPKKKLAKKQEVSDLIMQQADAAVKEQALAAANEILSGGGESKTSKVKKVTKKTKKVKKVKKPNQKALKAQAFREKLLKELHEIDSSAVVEETTSNVELRGILKAAKDAKKLAEKEAKKLAKEAADKLKADKKAAKELEKQQKKEAALKLKVEKQAAKEAALKLKAEKKAAKAEALKLKAEKKAAKELEKQQKKEAAEQKAKLESAATSEPDSSDEELEEEEILQDLELDDSEESAYPFNPITGQCTKEASGLDIDYYAICTEESFPEPVLDEDDEILLHDVNGEHIASYIDGVVIPVDDEE